MPINMTEVIKVELGRNERWSEQTGDPLLSGHTWEPSSKRSGKPLKGRISYSEKHSRLTRNLKQLVKPR